MPSSTQAEAALPLLVAAAAAAAAAAEGAHARSDNEGKGSPADSNEASPTPQPPPTATDAGAADAAVLVAAQLARAEVAALLVRYNGLRFRGDGSGYKLPWDVRLRMPPRPGEKRANVDIARVKAAEEGAVAFDIGTAWRQLHPTAGGGTPPEWEYNYPVYRYRQDTALWTRIRAARSLPQLRSLLTQMRDTCQLERMAQELAGQEQRPAPTFQHTPPQEYEQQQQEAATATDYAARSGGGRSTGPRQSKVKRKAGEAGGGRRKAGEGGSRMRSASRVPARSGPYATQDSKRLAMEWPLVFAARAAKRSALDGTTAATAAVLAPAHLQQQQQQHFTGSSLPPLAPLRQLQQHLEWLVADPISHQQAGQPAKSLAAKEASPAPPINPEHAFGQESGVQDAFKAQKTSPDAVAALAALLGAAMGPKLLFPRAAKALSPPQSSAAASLVALGHALATLGGPAAPAAPAPAAWQQQPMAAASPTPAWPALKTAPVLSAPPAPPPAAARGHQQAPFAWSPAPVAAPGMAPVSQYQQQQQQYQQYQQPPPQQQQYQQCHQYQHESLLQQLLLAAQKPAAVAAGLTPELAAVYLLALQCVPDAQQQQQADIMELLLQAEQHSSAISLATSMVAAVGLPLD